MALSAITMRMTRTMMLEVLRGTISAPHGPGHGRAHGDPAPRAAQCLIPVVTLVGLQAPLLIGGAVVIEQIFALPGMGLLLLEAVNQRDYPVITGVFTVVGAAVMLINLLVDLSYGLFDPKVRHR